MIYPTRLAVAVAAIGVPVALVFAVTMPDRWYLALAWPAAVLVATLADALAGPAPGAASLSLRLPHSANVGADIAVGADVTLRGATRPLPVEIALDAGPLLVRLDDDRAGATAAEGHAEAQIPFHCARRGTASVERAWVRWRGPMGLTWKQRNFTTSQSLAILPDIRPVHEQGARLFQRYALQGLIAQQDRGDGADFDALVEFQAGMDRRAIDWKQSARHTKLHAKQFRSERNNQIVFAIDAGRQMADPVAGVPRLDRAVSAMLLTAWVALKVGDRVALHAFDARPRLASGLVSGTSAFGELQRQAAWIGYSGEESNYSFALTTLAARLNRRSMIILMTEITDIVSADFLVRAAARIIERHLLLVVVLRDEELESILDRPPAEADDIARSVTAAALLRDRLLVLTRLRHLGVHVIESPHDRVGEQLVAGYAELKRRHLL